MTYKFKRLFTLTQTTFFGKAARICAISKCGRRLKNPACLRLNKLFFCALSWDVAGLFEQEKLFAGVLNMHKTFESNIRDEYIPMNFVGILQQHLIERQRFQFCLVVRNLKCLENGCEILVFIMTLIQYHLLADFKAYQFSFFKMKCALIEKFYYCFSIFFNFRNARSIFVCWEWFGDGPTYTWIMQNSLITLIYICAFARAIKKLKQIVFWAFKKAF